MFLFQCHQYFSTEPAYPFAMVSLLQAQSWGENGGVNVGSRPHWGVSSILLFLTQIDIDLGV